VRTLARCLLDQKPLWRIWALPSLIGIVTVPVALYMPLIQKDLVDDVFIGGRSELLIISVVLYSAAWIVAAGLNVAGGALRTYLDERLALDMRGKLFAHCEALSVPLWQQEHSGRIMSLFSSDVSNLASFTGSGLVIALGQIVTLLFTAFVMFSLNPALALVVVVLPAVVGGGASIISRPLRRASRHAQDKAAEASEGVHESLAGLREIAALDQGQRQSARLTATLYQLLRARMRLALIGAGITVGQSGFSLVATIVILGVGGYLVITGHTTLGTLVAFQLLYGQVFSSATALVGTVLNAQKALASADRIYEFLDIPPTVRDKPTARAPGDVRGEIRFEHVSFGYNPNQTVVEDISFSARPGEMVALVGPSGAGKTTIAGLISRFYDPDQGRVLLDGTDLRDLTLAGLRANIGIVFQDPFLFATTIRDNIAFGRPDASEAEIIAAARAANAWDFIQEQPQGLDTLVGQRAVRLSEGQKQRIAIARALLRDPRILVLDEPTAALDTRTEQLLQEALHNLMQGRTTFVIAHRLGTIQRADRILVLQRGRIVEQGSHPELLSLRGLYHELHQLQTGIGSNAAAVPHESSDAGLAVGVPALALVEEVARIGR
jgi:ATP-binding cassette, subfamily B, bacterial MsbA